MDPRARTDDRRELRDSKLTELALFAKELCPLATVEASAIQYEDEDGRVEMFPPRVYPTPRRTASRWHSPGAPPRSSRKPDSTSSARSSIRLLADAEEFDWACQWPRSEPPVPRRPLPLQ